MPAYRYRGLSSKRYALALADLKRRTGREVFSMEELTDAITADIKKHGPDPDGPPGLIHGDFGPACFDCNGVSDLLCDWPVGRGRTCDRAICEECTPPLAPDLHYCKAHRVEYEAFKATEMRGVVFAQFTGPNKPKRDHRRHRPAKDPSDA